MDDSIPELIDVAIEENKTKNNSSKLVKDEKKNDEFKLILSKKKRREHREKNRMEAEAEAAAAVAASTSMADDVELEDEDIDDDLIDQDEEGDNLQSEKSNAFSQSTTFKFPPLSGEKLMVCFFLN
jgi:hypothetical protein